TEPCQISVKISPSGPVNKGVIGAQAIPARVRMHAHPVDLEESLLVNDYTQQFAGGIPPSQHGGLLPVNRPFDPEGSLLVDRPVDWEGSLPVDRPVDREGSLPVDRPVDPEGSLPIDRIM
ncbi:hypothetical protein PTTG_25428, partial [Puccinia triticina 1-1 BBBD Race 1]|uniref:Uncharacterized protein n=1 Tax=Puccinia triticina (isolate 1-1 / race 1 (BBBD)) TaxID=630390 RepID=A0A0C4FDC6_PUCT1